MENYFRNLKLIQMLVKWRLHLGIVVLAAIVLSAVFSGPTFIKPKYKSYAVVYPSNIAEYSDESLTEQMLQIIQSTDIRDSIISHFDLMAHYGIDTNKEYWKSTLYYVYGKNIKISKTMYESIMIEVYDTDPQKACDIINAIIDYYNLKVRVLHNSKFSEVVHMYERHLIYKDRQLDSLNARMSELGSKYGLLDFDYQTQEVTRGFLRTVQGGSGNVNTSEVLRIKKNMEEYGGEWLMLKEIIKNEAINYATIKKEFDNAVMNLDRGYTYVNLVTPPEPADKKTYPVRWIIVTISALAALLFSIIAIGLIENARPTQRKEDLDETA
ncbi:MAG: Wzz/FepE/Etk N-terminal domain-containing protein [Bacteroidales bacterium]|nr:Wzz/FepE/Etk N-terminal domain-containing protein [Bacteroidales bacterium]